MPDNTADVLAALAPVLAVRHLYGAERTACGTADEFAAVEFDTARVTCRDCLAAALVTQLVDVTPVIAELDPPTVPVDEVRARDLVRGDVLVHADGTRLCAAFDLAEADGAPIVTVWTATRDQEAGQPPRFDLHANLPVLIAPRA